MAKQTSIKSRIFYSKTELNIILFHIICLFTFCNDHAVHFTFHIQFENSNVSPNCFHYFLCYFCSACAALVSSFISVNLLSILQYISRWQPSKMIYYAPNTTLKVRERWTPISSQCTVTASWRPESHPFYLLRRQASERKNPDEYPYKIH